MFFILFFSDYSDRIFLKLDLTHILYIMLKWPCTALNLSKMVKYFINILPILKQYGDIFKLYRYNTIHSLKHFKCTNSRMHI